MSELVTIEESTALQAFTSENGLESVIEQTKNAVAEFEHDLSTASGRKRTASLANKVAKVKCRLDGMGKDLVADWKASAKAVDANRKSMRDELDQLKILARAPLTDWEAEEAEREAAEAALLEAEKLAIQVESDHEIGLLLNDKIDRDAKEAADKAAQEAKEVAEKAKQEQIERDAKVAKMAAEMAFKQAEQVAREEAEKVEREKREALAREQAAKAQAEQAQRDKIAAEERAKAQAEMAEKMRLQAIEQAKIDAEKAAESARVAEQERQAAEVAKLDLEREARELNKRHVGFIRKTAKECLMEYVDEKAARLIVLAIDAGKITNVSITY